MSLRESNLNAAPNQQEYDAIVIGAGHNGLATATVLSKQGQRVLVLEKNNYVGGMGGTREILKGCRNEVGASCLFPLSKEIKDYFQFEENGVELIPLPVMAVNLSGPNSRPLIFYKNPLKVIVGVCRSFGPGAMLGFVRFIKFCAYPAQVLDRFTARKAPRSLQDLINDAPTEGKRAQLELAFHGSAMDIINKFFPDKIKHKELRSSLAFAAVQATYKGPYSKGSGMCLIYTMAQEGSEGMMQRVKGGLGTLSESLVDRLESMGSKVLLKKQVNKILLENTRAVGVELKNGERFFANVIVSNLDKPATFDRLLSEHQAEHSVKQRIDKFEHKGAFMHLLFKLTDIPQYGGEFEKLNNIPFSQFGGAMVHDPDELQSSFEVCQRGELPTQIPLAFQFPSLMDDTLAPDGFHVASAYAFYFPCEAEKSAKGKLRDQFTEMVIDQIGEYMPTFRELIVDKAVFSAEHFASMEGATNGDWTHGLLHPEQMVGDRSLLGDKGHSTPYENLFLCGASCHPGPGVTFLPGYNCAHEILALALPGAEVRNDDTSDIDCAA
ncbi:MAG: NAD(P)/FAD-dependent oxidoreductase [Pseudomonadota bacterium]